MAVEERAVKADGERYRGERAPRQLTMYTSTEIPPGPPCHTHTPTVTSLAFRAA